MSLSKAKTPYKSLTLAQKVAVIKEVEKGLKKKSEIAKEFGIPPNTLSTYLKNKDRILSSENGTVKNRKRSRGPDNPDVDGCVLKWFKQARDKDIPISGPIMRAKAEQFASALGSHDFKASTGWLNGFKNRNDISFKAVCGESGAVNIQAADEWKKHLKEIIQEKDPKNIFNVDETGLFYKCTPNKTLAFKGETCSGGKLSKERVTLLVGANMDGSEKLPLLMIGKSANPRCFKNVKSKPVSYESNKKAWMTSEIFEKWLLNLNKNFGKQKREIVLFIDNCTAHNSIPEMKNVKVIFFPANMTSVIQPMDQGVIKNLKHFYRRLLVESILIGDFDVNTNFNILHASRMCRQAWDKVSERTIMKCFHKAGFVKKETEGVNVVENFEEIDPELAVDNWEDVKSDPSILYEDYVNVDQNVVVCGEATDADIIAELTENNQHEDGLSGDEEDKEIQEKRLPSSSEAMVHIHELRRFFEGQSNVEDSIFLSIDKLESYAMTQRLQSQKQSKISDFFLKIDE